METNSSISATTTITEAMNKFPSRHGAMEIFCCENDSPEAGSGYSSQVGLVLPGDDGTGKTGQQRQSSSLSVLHFHGCHQQHKERRRMKQQNLQQQHCRISRRRLIPFSSSVFSLLLLAMATTRRRQAGLLLPVNAQPSKNVNGTAKTKTRLMLMMNDGGLTNWWWDLHRGMH
jgi:hypothetical protein